MNISIVLVAAGIALFFVLWPIGGKYLGIPGPWIGALTMLGSGLTVWILSWKRLALDTPTVWPIVGLLAISVGNGWAVYTYGVKSGDPSIPTGPFVVLVSVLMVVLAAMLDSTLLIKQAPSYDKMFGYLCAVAAIYLLGR